MLGWRGRIGLLVPATNTVAEREFWKWIPDGLTVCTARVVSIAAEDEVERLAGYRTQVIKAAHEVKHANPDIIAWTCTSGSFVTGAGYDIELAEEVRKLVGTPTVTTSTAVIEAVRRLGISRLAMGTPYRDSVTEIERRFLEESIDGLKVVNTVNLSVLGPGKRGLILPERVYQLGREVNAPDAEAVFLSCTDVRTIEVLDCLEADLGKPVFSSNLATLWAVLRRLGVSTRFLPGRLCETA